MPPSRRPGLELREELALVEVVLDLDAGEVLRLGAVFQIVHREDPADARLVERGDEP
jgi:hypothetical protein